MALAAPPMARPSSIRCGTSRAPPPRMILAPKTPRRPSFNHGASGYIASALLFMALAVILSRAAQKKVM